MPVNTDRTEAGRERVNHMREPQFGKNGVEVSHTYSTGTRCFFDKKDRSV